jgi:hypothetical protein
MDFIKKHYEKIVLSVVLLGLVGALVFLPVLISNDRQRLDDIKAGIIGGRPKALPALDMSRQDGVLGRLQSPYALDFSTTNKLFNPVEWKKDYSGNMIKLVTGHEVGVGAVVVTNISPLYLVLTLDAVQTNELGAIYLFSVERKAAPTQMLRRKHPHYASKGEKNEDFMLTGVKGDPDNPDELLVKLADSGAAVPVSKGKPFQRVDAYMADLKYGPGNKSYQNQRVGSIVSFDGDAYLIVAIDQNEVILSAQ